MGPKFMQLAVLWQVHAEKLAYFPATKWNSWDSEQNKYKTGVFP